MTKKIVRVTRDQVDTARTLVRIAGGVDKVEPVIARVAQAKPAATSPPRATAKAS